MTAPRRSVGGGGPSPLVQLSGFLRKEFFEIIRQPRLLLVMVVGPFLVLLLFAVGFDQKQGVLKTMFVGPPASVYEDSLEEYAESLQQYVSNAGYTSDLVAAESELSAGNIDVVVVFPSDPVESVLSGEPAVINVLHNKIDPIQQLAVDVSTQFAVQELNARILERVLGQAQQTLVPFGESVTTSTDLLAELDAAIDAGDRAEVERIARDFEASTGALSQIVAVSEAVATELEGTDERRAELVDLTTSVDELATSAAVIAASPETATAAQIDDARVALEALDAVGTEVTTVDPRVIVRPFAGESASLQRESIKTEDYFAPAAIALLLQHMVLTFASLSLVSDRSLGLFELFRVGPISTGRILVGKFVSFTLVGGVVATALLAAMTLGLDVPFRGDFGWVVVGVTGLLIASIALGACISLIATSDTQAVQYALLALLAGLFFSGFFLELDAFRYPVKAVAWTMPVTYGVRILRDVMLRGVDPASADLLGLAAVSVAYIAASWVLLRTRLKVR